MIPQEIHEEIMRRLEAVQREHEVRILLAIESGSRAWGFASPDSDFDVRFIYCRAKDWYVAVDLEERRDVIDYPIVDEIDLNGWDIRKALRLFWKSNPALIEWLQSPIKYIEQGGFAAGARQLMSQVYSLERGMYHYRSMAKTNYHQYLRDEQVRLKKYFYVLRPLLSVFWIERYQTAAPIEFDRLLHLLDEWPEVLQAIHALLLLKRDTPELGLSPQVPVLNHFIESHLQRLEKELPAHTERGPVLSELNQLLHASLAENWA